MRVVGVDSTAPPGVGGSDLPVAAAGSAVPTGPVPGLSPEQTAPLPVDVPRRGLRRRRPRRLLLAALVALVGAAIVLAAFVVDHGAPQARSAPAPLRLSTPLMSARRAPELVSRPVALRAAQAATAPVVARFPDASCVLVTDGTAVLSDRASTTPLAPASNTKVLTGSAALSVLGADSTLTTAVVAPSAPVGGRIAGDLYLVGGGDPLLSTATATARMRHGQEPTTSLEALADRVVAAGVHQVDGAIVGDGTRYDGERKVPTWPDRFIAQGTVANLGALMVNDSWTIDPIDPKGAPGAAAPDPAAAAASAFTALLRARGVQIGGQPTAGTAPTGATEVASMSSLPVKDVVGEMLTFSDNTTAEMLVKEMAVHSGAPGTTADGIRVLVTDLATRGLPTAGLELHDGSGLSRENRVTCRLLDAVLAGDGADGTIAQRLARPGAPGTLDDRFTTGALKDRIAAKTGTLNDVTALSGWLTTDPGRRVAFSIIENPSGRPSQAGDLALMGQLLTALLPYPQTPPLDQLGPRPPVAT